MVKYCKEKYCRHEGYRGLPYCYYHTCRVEYCMKRIDGTTILICKDHRMVPHDRFFSYKFKKYNK